MKKYFNLLLAALILCAPMAYAADSETGIIAEAYENPQGRSVVFNQSELVTVWHDSGTAATNGQIGVSGTTAGQNLNLVLYEGGQPITATRFGGFAQISVGFSSTCNTAKKIASLINSDTSGFFKASVGRDATPGTAVMHTGTQNISANLATTQRDAVNGQIENSANRFMLLDDTSSSDRLIAGFRADPKSTYRLKQIEETAQGAGVHTISVWNNEERVYIRTYASKAAYAGTSMASDRTSGVTPLTIKFTDGLKGLAGTKGKNLTVESSWTTSMDGDSESTTNLSILAGDWRG